MYDRTLVEGLLCALWNAGILVDDTAPDTGMPKSKADPSHLGNIVVYMIDINRTWERVELDWNTRAAIFLHYAQGWTQKQIGLQLGIRQQLVGEMLAVGVSKLLADINGEDYREDETE